MASKSDAFENALLRLVFNNVSIALIGDATGIVGSGTTGQLFWTLCTADPGDAGNQSTSEISYTGYNRPGVARTTGGFTVSGSAAALTSGINFNQMTGGAGGVASFYSLGASGSGTGLTLYSGPITPNITVSLNVTPQISSMAITED